MTLSLRGSITATEFAATRTEPAPEPDSLTAAATSAASNTVAAAAISHPPRRDRRAADGGGLDARGGGSSAGSCARIARSSSCSRGPGSRPSCSTIAFRASR